MPLGTEIGLGLCDILFDVDPATPEKRAQPLPNFWPMSVVAKWLDEEAAWCGSRPRPRPHYTRRGPSSRERGIAAPPLFGQCLLSIVYVAHLSYC